MITVMVPMPDEIDVDDRYDVDRRIRYIGKARRQSDGTYRCAAIIAGTVLCIVEVRVTPQMAG